MVSAINANPQYQTSAYRSKAIDNANNYNYSINSQKPYQKPIKKKNRIITPQWLAKNMLFGFIAGAMGTVAGYLFNLVCKNKPEFSIKSCVMSGALWSVLFLVLSYILEKFLTPKTTQ